MELPSIQLTEPIAKKAGIRRLRHGWRPIVPREATDSPNKHRIDGTVHEHALAKLKGYRMRLDDFPEKPIFSPELVEDCRKRGDYRPMLFEWYKHVGIVCNLFASIQAHSPAFREVEKVHFAVLVGLLNRCSRLMLSNIALSSKGRFGETTRLIDRCIAESALKIQWLSMKADNESFERYLADGLKKDLVLKSEIEANIANRGGSRLQIENRMLESIDRCIRTSGLSEDAIDVIKRLPDLNSMMRDLSFGDALYTVVQRMGSHSIHGTWTDLITHYLKEDDSEGLVLRDHDVAIHHNQFVFISILVLRAMRQFLLFMTLDDSYAEGLIGYLEEVERDILVLEEEDRGSDFDPV